MLPSKITSHLQKLAGITKDLTPKTKSVILVSGKNIPQTLIPLETELPWYTVLRLKLAGIEYSLYNPDDLSIVSGPTMKDIFTSMTNEQKFKFRMTTLALKKYPNGYGFDTKNCIGTDESVKFPPCEPIDVDRIKQLEALAEKREKYVRDNTPQTA